MKNDVRGKLYSFGYIKGTDERLNKIEGIAEGLVDDFYNANSMKVTKDKSTNKQVHRDLELLADYVLESENLTTKKNEYNILDKKRLKDVEINEQQLPSYSNDDEETVAEAQLTNAIVNRERLLKYEDTVDNLLKGDYELINEGAAIEDLWFYQALENNEDARNLVEDCFNLIQYYISKLKKSGSNKGTMATRRKIKEILFGDIGAIVRSYTKHEPMQKRSGVKAYSKQTVEFSGEVASGKHYSIFKALVADKGSITKPIDIIPIADVEQAIDNGIQSGQLNSKDIEMIELLKKNYSGDLLACLKVNNNYKTNRRRFEKLINKLEKII
ncbi:short-chain dehydrogenase [Neobacillus sp. MER 74]|uniref:short-chain dehydrogenase n=1 Tax=Neobacillus sp. MER 74 TaxID=2939566 RepID=UPI00203B0A33|nr:short-chain dehydrogenase [Neobacillus sp. MER 74]MCM3115465.1 short-chain dehydrogenase [Neobacillus sp. MER 74]